MVHLFIKVYHVFLGLCQGLPLVVQNSIELNGVSDHTWSGTPDPPAPSEESPAVISHNKRKRPGLSDGLTPSKKASKFYNQVYGNKP